MFFGILAGVLLGCAFLAPGTLIGAVLGWVATIYLIKAAKSRPLQGPFMCGVFAHLIGFYWISETVSRFGGLPWIAGIAMLFLFSVAHGAYLPLAAFGATKLVPRSQSKNFTTNSELLLFAAFFAALESSPLRLFPWQLGASQLAFPMAQIADIGGASLVSFLMILVSGLILRQTIKPKVYALGLLVVANCYGALAPKFVNTERSLNFALIQANVSIEDKHNETLLTTNIKEYVSRTNELERQDLVVWPESVVIEPLPLFFTDAQKIIGLEQLTTTQNLLIGAISGNYNSIGALTQIYNSGLQIVGSEILSRYHKRFLVPFGETVPFIESFPWLINLTPFLMPISPGRSPGLMTYRGRGGDFKIAALICYEDILPWMSREGTALGADLLVNITNDAWFGGGVALSQHHLLAAFRAIENRRSLVRSTNTGLTGIIDPFGKTFAELPKNTDGTLLAQVPISRYRSLYTQFFGGFWPSALAALLALLALKLGGRFFFKGKA